MLNEDYYDDFFPQASTQWDSLSHIRHLELGYYNGIDRAETPIAGGHRLGIQNWAERGIVGRFVLLDVARHRSAAGAPLDYGVCTAIGPGELDAVMQAQGVTFHRGDILLLRFGWTEWYDGLDRGAREAFAAHDPSPGLEQGERMAGWLWDHGIAAVVADCPAVEAAPFDVSYADGFLHYRLIALLGFALGELFAPGDFARHCAEVNRHTGLFTAAPIQMVGGVGSPGNALAIM
jgi:hypothetical protein